MKTKIKALLFDLDGTLLNTDELVIRSYERVFETFRPDYPLSEEEKQGFLGPTLEEKFAHYFEEDFDTLLEVYHTFALAHMKEFASCYPHVKEVLTQLKKEGYFLGVVTSRFRESALEVLDGFGLTSLFDTIVTLSDVKEAKPSPEGILSAMRSGGFGNEEVLFLGDASTDYLAGKNAGVFTGLVAWCKRWDRDECQPDFVLNDFEDLEKILQEEKM